VVIFQPDTGVVEHHACLPPRIHLDPRAANFVEEGEPPVDPLTSSGNPGHGTGTASVVASPDGSSMTGAAPLVTLVPIRCIESVTVFDQSPVARAIDHARRNGAHIITMSLGGVASSALHAAVKKATHDNVIVLAAAGNCVGEVVWPARYSEVIAVGGINEVLAPWRGSCHGPAVDVCAPAEFVARANPRDPADPSAAVDGGQGTSFAVALTAGVAGLWLAHHGREKLIQLLPAGRNLQDMFNNIVRATAQVPAGFDTGSFGAGIVDASSLLQFDPAHAFDLQVDRRLTEEFPADGLRSLVMSAFGGGGVEAAGDLLSDPQHAAELACAALDRVRAGRSLRAHVESMPPIQLSPTLRRRLGSKFPLTLTR